MTGDTRPPGIHPQLYDLDHLPNPLDESHHALIAQDPETREFVLLTKHQVFHEMGEGVTFTYVGWSDPTEEEAMV